MSKIQGKSFVLLSFFLSCRRGDEHLEALGARYQMYKAAFTNKVAYNAKLDKFANDLMTTVMKNVNIQSIDVSLPRIHGSIPSGNQPNPAPSTAPSTTVGGTPLTMNFNATLTISGFDPTIMLSLTDAEKSNEQKALLFSTFNISGIPIPAMFPLEGRPIPGSSPLLVRIPIRFSIVVNETLADIEADYNAYKTALMNLQRYNAAVDKYAVVFNTKATKTADIVAVSVGVLTVSGKPLTGPNKHSSVPTVSPTVKPTPAGITPFPSAKPTMNPTAIPTLAPTLASIVSFDASLTMKGLNVSQMTTKDEDAIEASTCNCLSLPSADCQFVVAIQKRIVRRLTGSLFTVEISLSTSPTLEATIITKIIQTVTGNSVTATAHYDELVAQLTASVNSGNFTETLKKIAIQFNATATQTVQVDAIVASAPTIINPNPTAAPTAAAVTTKSDDAASPVLPTGGIIGIAVGGAVVSFAVVFFFFFSRGSSKMVKVHSEPGGSKQVQVVGGGNTQYV
jgi:hypothetical protein